MKSAACAFTFILLAAVSFAQEHPTLSALPNFCVCVVRMENLKRHPIRR